MRLILVRHAETVLNDEGIMQGVTNGELTEKGVKQAELLAKRLAKEKIDVIYSSDYERCKDTLEPLLKIREIPVVFVKELRERNFGIFDGKPWEEFDSWKEKQTVARFDKKPEGGESYNEVIERVSVFVDRLLKEGKDKTVLIMAHGGTKRAVLMNLFDRKDEEYYDSTKDISKNTALTIVNINGGKFDIELFYSVDHLEGL